jgi:hypothetical protein
MDERSCVILENDYYRVELLDGESIVRVVRSSRPFCSAQAAHEACEPVQEALDTRRRSRIAVLIDSRAAPLRNDPEYESWFAPHRKRMIVGVRKSAILVRSSAGVLHTERVMKLDRAPSHARIFLDEDEALAYLRERAPRTTR